ncbi:MAG: RidA family protein [Alphaproteobacteria bacterium]
MAETIVQRLARLGIELPEPAVTKAANIETVLIHRGSLRVSGQLPVWNGEIRYRGRAGAERTLDEATAAARLSALNVLAQARRALDGDLGRIERVLNLRGFVAVADGFTEVAQAVNGASNLMIEAFGDAGRHTRTAVGVSAMPHNVTVEIEALFALRD